jgi:O-antigen/teichoic acid export membrane protein
LYGLSVFGSRVLVANLVDALYRRVHGTVIGKGFGAVDAGWYARAQSTQEMPSGLLAGMLNRVALPVFSRTAAEPGRLAEAFGRALRLLMFLNLPVMAGMAVVADPLVVAVFGPAWRPAVPILQILCVCGALWPVHVLNVSAMLARGEADLLLRLELGKKGIGLVALCAALPYGLHAIAWSQVLASVAAFFLNTWHGRHIRGLRATEQLRVIAPSLVSTAIMVAAVVGAGFVVPDASSWQALALLVPVGVLTYALASWMFDRSPWHELALYLRSRPNG